MNLKVKHDLAKLLIFLLNHVLSVFLTSLGISQQFTITVLTYSFTLEVNIKCVDPVTKKSYRTGEIWTRGDFACTACVCKGYGQLNCWSIQCHIPGCKNPARVEGRCCKFCMENDGNKG